MSRVNVNLVNVNVNVNRLQGHRHANATEHHERAVGNVNLVDIDRPASVSHLTDTLGPAGGTRTLCKLELKRACECIASRCTITQMPSPHALIYALLRSPRKASVHPPTLLDASAQC
jgi:hypothetical protein